MSTLQLTDLFHSYDEKNDRILKVTIAHQYGQEIIQPKCDNSKKFCEIAGTKTMTKRLVEQVKSLGYRVEVIPTQPKEL